MKCWVVEDLHADWIMLVHGETVGKAKSNFMRWEPSGMFFEYTDLRANRISKWDDLPITHKNATAAGFQYRCDYDELGYEIEIEFINDCKCHICRHGKEI